MFKMIFLFRAFLGYEVLMLLLGCAILLCWMMGNLRRFATFLILCGILAGSIAIELLIIGEG